MSDRIKDAEPDHWVYKAPLAWRPYLQLARYDRPVGYWLLALPGWIGLAFASLSHGLALTDLKWATLIFIGAVAMRGAGCTYNDIVDRDLDAQVDRTAKRPIPAETVSLKQAWVWLFVQCFVGLLVLLTLPRFAQVVALCSIPLVAAYPFMKRITWWPQVWLGLTFNWAVLVAYSIKTGTLSPAVIILYVGLMFWTVGYDTIYACQDIEDDALIGVKSTARRFGKRVKLGIALSYGLFALLFYLALFMEGQLSNRGPDCRFILGQLNWYEWNFRRSFESFYFALFQHTSRTKFISIFILSLFVFHLGWQIIRLRSGKFLSIFKSNQWVPFLLVFGLLFHDLGTGLIIINDTCGINITDIESGLVKPICYPSDTNMFCDLITPK